MAREMWWADFSAALFLSLYHSSITIPLIVKETYDLLPSIKYDKSDVTALIKSCYIHLSIYLSI